MQRIVTTPPPSTPTSDGHLSGGWWRDAEKGRILCELCPRECNLKEGDRGFCFVRQNINGEMMLTTYGRSTGFCIDPIEKKPLNHFYPGTSVLSFGTAGCNLGCKFCQNWDISKSREVQRLSEVAMPEAIATAAQHHQCKSVAFTYNDPVIWAEYAIDTAIECHRRDIETIAVTAGYISDEPREEFFSHMSAANIDLKAFTEEFYFNLTYSHIKPVLETLKWLSEFQQTWFEITNLVIPDANDSTDELRELCDWILEHCGDEVPIHFTAFHPDFKMQDRPRTSHETLLRAYEVARRQGIKYPYVGNVHDVKHQSTFCASCGELLIERDWYKLGVYNLNLNTCSKCSSEIPGCFAPQPGTWGAGRQPIKIRDFVTLELPQNAQEQTPPPSESQKMENTAAIELSSSQEQAIHALACQVVCDEVCASKETRSVAALEGADKEMVMGAFVTLKKNGTLRSCCGVLGQPMKLIHALDQSARRTATSDPRFPPVSPSELPELDVDVSLLHNIQPVTCNAQERHEHIEIGKHGLIIEQSGKRGLLLPVVAVEHHADERAFLEMVCRKAGIPIDAWQSDDASLETFETIVTEGPMPNSCAAQLPSQQACSFINNQSLRQLALMTHQNIDAMLMGATPSYVMPGIPDGNVKGLLYQLTHEDGSTIGVMQFAMNKTVPLHSTLLQNAQNLAGQLSQSHTGASDFVSTSTPSLALLDDPAIHGRLSDESDLSLDTTTRMLVAMDENVLIAAYDSSSDTKSLIDTIRSKLPSTSIEHAQLISFAVNSTTERLHYTRIPKARSFEGPRPPAVAGAFYPGTKEELDRVVEDLIQDAPDTKVTASAVMVPHAGLIYSGQLAADVLGQVDIPETVIIIGPKHTRVGLPWAVSPCSSWSLPGCELQSDTSLAAQLVDGISGLEFDAGAHASEHCIEMELILLAKLAPKTKVVGIAMGNATLQECTTFANELNTVLNALDNKPLLIISSDMHHFGTQEVNNSLDRKAIDAMHSLNPEQLFDTVKTNQISMCGMIPAVIVMQALLDRGELNQCTEVGYYTSGKITGSYEKVVGYCGLVLN